MSSRKDETNVTEHLLPSAMGKGGVSFTLFGFPIHVGTSFLFMSTMVALMGPDRSATGLVVWVTVAFVSVLWHELGHALAGRVFGLEAKISLHGLGGLTQYSSGKQLSWGVDAILSLAGPVAGLILGSIVWIAALFAPRDNELLMRVIEVALWANWGWSLVNLVPIVPYDGGQALRAVLRKFLGARHVIVSNWVTLVVGSAACIYAIAMRWPFAAFLAGAPTVGAYRTIRDAPALRRLSAAWKALHDGEIESAANVAAEFVKGKQSNSVREIAAELGAWCALRRGEIAGAHDALAAHPSPGEVSRVLTLTLDVLDEKDLPAELPISTETQLIAMWLILLRGLPAADGETLARHLVTPQTRSVLTYDGLHVLALNLYQVGDYTSALVVMQQAFAAHGQSTDAYNAACCLARLGELEQSRDWLRQALAAGYNGLDALRRDEDLAALVAQPDFEAWLSSHAPSPAPNNSPPSVA